MKNELYNKLVDVYADGELPEDLQLELETEAAKDPLLAQDMHTLRHTVESLRSMPSPEFTEESYQRILMKVYARGVDIQPKAEAPAHLQYYLPMQG
jgi:anti-sigma factor RsiW